MTHTPFMACDRGDYGDYDGECVVVLDEEMTRRVAVVFKDEDAAFIVKAVNAHEHLVGALIEAFNELSALEPQGFSFSGMDRIAAVLASVE